MQKKNLERNAVLNVRTYDETKIKLKELTKLKSEELGTKLTQAQTLEMLLTDELKRYGKQ